MYETRDFVELGGLMSYGSDFDELFRRAADYVAKILNGANPATLPIQQSSKIELVLNMKTARAIGLTMPQSIVVRADEVIE
jgi:putative ABC transport system substrate-binding protein